MQIFRTLLWVLLLAGVLMFSFGNWDKQIDVRIWPDIVWDTRVPALVVVSWLLGLVPMWLYHRGVSWQHKRRITAMETATAKMVATPAEPAKPVVPVRPEAAPSDVPPPAPNPVDPEPSDKP